MPRLVHKQPAYFYHKASNRARVRYRGKDHYLPGAFGSAESRKAYHELLARLVSEEAEPGASKPTAAAAPAPSLLTIAELIEKYWEHAGLYYRRDGVPTGEADVIRSALRPSLALFGYLLVTEFRTKHLKQVREEMIRLGWSRRYINDSIRRTRAMFAWGTEEELVPVEVTGALKMVKGLKEGRSEAREKPEVGSVPDAVVDATLPHISEIFGDMIRLMRLSGMRPGEALSLTVEEIDRSDSECWQYKPRSHKTRHRGRERIIFLGPKCQAILSPWILKAGMGRVYPVTGSGFRTSINRACARAFPHPVISKIPRSKRTEAQRAELKAWRKAHQWHPNQLRHTAATEIRRQFGAEGAQVILGHAHIKTTEIYAEVDAERGREIASKVG
jgi:integrase